MIRRAGGISAWAGDPAERAMAKDNASLIAICIKGNNMVCIGLVITTVALILIAVDEKIMMQLTDMVFCQINSIEVRKHRFPG